MLLFHGSRSIFSAFDPAFVGTGEGAGVGVGFYFVNSLKGAAAHAERYVKSSGSPLVYVCKLREPYLMLHMNCPITKHSPAVVKHWDSLPIAQFCVRDQCDWFSQLFRGLPFGNPNPEPTEKEKYRFLVEHGFHAIYDSEGKFTDAYLHGTSIVVLDANIIDIVEVLPVEKIYSEIAGVSQEYYLADCQHELGKTGLPSYLRKVIQPLNPMHIRRIS